MKRNAGTEAPMSGRETRRWYSWQLAAGLLAVAIAIGIAAWQNQRHMDLPPPPVTPQVGVCRSASEVAGKISATIGRPEFPSIVTDFEVIYSGVAPRVLGDKDSTVWPKLRDFHLALQDFRYGRIDQNDLRQKAVDLALACNELEPKYPPK